MIIPRADININIPEYSYYDETEYLDEQNNAYSSENLSYGANVSISQYLPTNTEINSKLYYNYYQNYREAGYEKDGLSGQTLEFTINQNIWGTNKGFHYYKIWRNESKINNIQNDRYNLEILKEAYTNYIDYLIAKRNYLLNKKMYERYRDIYESAKNKYKMGLFDLITYNRVKKEYKFYELDFNDSKRKLKSQKQSLEMFLNTEFNDIEFSVENIGYDIFEGKQPEARITEKKLEFDNAYRNYKFNKANSEVKLYASISSKYSNFGEEDFSGIENDNYSISMTLSIPFANLSKVSSLNNAEINYLIEKYKKEDEIENIRINYKNLKSDLKNYHEKLALYDDILPDLKENYNISLKRFNMGMITLEELRSIENEYINAELNYLRALKNYNLTAIELGKYIGNIDKIMEELL
jgi:outer membrane protein TolC